MDCIIRFKYSKYKKKFEILIKYIKDEIADEYLNNDQNLIKLYNTLSQKQDEIIMNNSKEKKDLENISSSIKMGAKVKKSLEKKILNDFRSIKLFRDLSENG